MLAPLGLLHVWKDDLFLLVAILPKEQFSGLFYRNTPATNKIYRFLIFFFQYFNSIGQEK